MTRRGTSPVAVRATSWCSPASVPPAPATSRQRLTPLLRARWRTPSRRRPRPQLEALLVGPDELDGFADHPDIVDDGDWKFDWQAGMLATCR